MAEKSQSEKCAKVESARIVQLLSPTFDLNQIKRCDVEIGSLGYDIDQSIAFTLENVFTAEECKSMISYIEQQGLTKVPVNIGGREKIDESVRTGERVMIDDEEFVAKLWHRISAHVPKKVKGGRAVGLNERIRFLKYHPGQFFAPHGDGSYARRDRMEISLLTIQMYLNEGFKGGNTTFLTQFGSPDKKSKRVPVVPKTGMVLVFAQDLIHEGSLVKKGVKYTARTDIMYSYETGS